LLKYFIRNDLRHIVCGAEIGQSWAIGPLKTPVGQQPVHRSSCWSTVCG
jgi:hypothetical protein